MWSLSVNHPFVQSNASKTRLLLVDFPDEGLKRGAALAHNALWDWVEYPAQSENSRPDPRATCAAERRLKTTQ